MADNDPGAFIRAPSDPLSRVRSVDPGAFGIFAEAVCPPLNTGNRRNQTAVQRLTYQPPGSDPTPPERYRVKFDWIDSNTDAVAHLVAAEMNEVIAIQDRTAPGYNCEHWNEYPVAQRWDAQRTGQDLGGTLPIDEVLHLAGSVNSAECAGFSSYLLDYGVEANRDMWELGLPVLLSRHNAPDADQRFMSTLFQQLRPQMHGTLVSVYDDSGSNSGNPPPYTGAVYGVIDWTIGSSTSADPAENMFLKPPPRGQVPTNPQAWVVEPPTGSIEGGTSVSLYSRAVGIYGTHPMIKPGVGGGVPSPKPEVIIGWQDTYRLSTILSNFNPLPSPGTSFTCTRL